MKELIHIELLRMPRGSGKTTFLIKESARTGKPIITATGVDVQQIVDMAQEMGVQIPEPISALRWINNRNYYRGKKLFAVDGFLIDDVDRVLTTVFDGSIDKVTYTPKEMKFINSISGVDYRINAYGNLEAYCGEDMGWMHVKNLNESEKSEMCTDNATLNDGVDYNFYQNYKACEDIDQAAHDTLCMILDINVIAPRKVVEITFVNGIKEKMVCHENDTFDLRKCCFIAIAKHLYKQEYTQEGIEYMATQLTYQKKYVKIVDTALKAYAKKEKDKEAAEKERIEREKITARQRERRRKQKERRIQRYREDMIDLLADSINEAKKRRKQSM